jgi:hypothetical protein
LGEKTFKKFLRFPTPTRLSQPQPGKTSFEAPLTAQRRGPDSDDYSALALLVEYHQPPASLTPPPIMMMGQGTNWMSTLTDFHAAEEKGVEVSSSSNHWLSATVTAVDLVQKGDQLWLGFTYLLDIDADWKPALHAEASSPETEVRSSRLLEGASRAQYSRLERSEIMLPRILSEAEAEALRDKLAQELLDQPRHASMGQHLQLFWVPLRDDGYLRATIVVQFMERPPSVKLKFQDVQLIETTGQPRLLLDYSQENHRADVSFQSSGRFATIPVDLQSGTFIKQGQPGEPASELHQLGLLLPPDMDPKDRDRLREYVAARWAGQSLILNPGDIHTLIEVMVPGREPVRVSVAGRLVESKP